MRLILIFLFLFGALEARKKETTVLSTEVMPTVVVDAGHGGTDRGTRSKTPFCEEKRLCLQTAKLVKKYLDQLGYHVVMTRNTDAFIPLSRRVEIASQARSSVFVSIHYNAAKNSTANGMEIFFYDTKEDRTRSVASKRLAEAILPGLLRRTNANSRGVKKGNYYVLRENTIPAIIIEGGFISNPQECALLRTISYQDRIARGIADGIDQYFKMNAS
ncbi:MAG TPA: N-acetylmuramoyl-L-alanine amidase [Chlamydiales bacterium]|nr:N-acetylmuramoyl-L-alanine amidase [Chlamydiales bacterium]